MQCPYQTFYHDNHYPMQCPYWTFYPESLSDAMSILDLLPWVIIWCNVHIGPFTLSHYPMQCRYWTFYPESLSDAMSILDLLPWQRVILDTVSILEFYHAGESFLYTLSILDLFPCQRVSTRYCVNIGPFTMTVIIR